MKLVLASLAAFAGAVLWAHAGARDLGARSVTAELVAVRQAVFAELNESDRMFRATPEQLVEAGFLLDTKPPPPQLLRAKTATTGDPLFNALTLLHEIPWKNSKYCVSGGSLAKKSDELKKGKTCCSDNVELFLAQLQVEGVFAREVHTKRHVVAEVYSPESRGWVFVDPSYGIMAFGPDEQPLSLLELRERMLAKQPYDLRFVGGELARDGKTVPSEIPFYSSPEELETISVVLGNNVFDVDRDRADSDMPEPVRQAMGLARGTEPRTVVLLDAHSDEARKIASMRPRLAVVSLAGAWLGILGLLGVRRFAVDRGASKRRRMP